MIDEARSLVNGARRGRLTSGGSNIVGETCRFSSRRSNMVSQIVTYSGLAEEEPFDVNLRVTTCVDYVSEYSIPVERKINAGVEKLRVLNGPFVPTGSNREIPTVIFTNFIFRPHVKASFPR